MNNRAYLTLDDARRIAAAAEAEALAQGFPVTIAIADEGGHLLWLQRLDRAAPLSAQIAPAKARAAALSRKETKVYEDMINQGRQAFLSTSLEGLLEGGLPILVGGECIGAIGVSGAKSTEDVQVGRAGLAALGG